MSFSLRSRVLTRTQQIAHAVLKRFFFLSSFLQFFLPIHLFSIRLLIICVCDFFLCFVDALYILLLDLVAQS